METNVTTINPVRTLAELIVYATQHESLKVREAACEAIYQRGRADAANEIAAAMAASPASAPAPASVTP